MSASDAAPLPRLGEVFFDVRGSSRTMRLSWYADTGVAVFSIWQGGKCTGTFRLPIADLPRMMKVLQDGPLGGGRSGHGAEQDWAVSDAAYSGQRDFPTGSTLQPDRDGRHPEQPRARHGHDDIAEPMAPGYGGNDAAGLRRAGHGSDRAAGPRRAGLRQETADAAVSFDADPFSDRPYPGYQAEVQATAASATPGWAGRPEPGYGQERFVPRYVRGPTGEFSGDIPADRPDIPTSERRDAYGRDLPAGRSESADYPGQSWEPGGFSDESRYQLPAESAGTSASWSAPHLPGRSEDSLTAQGTGRYSAGRAEADNIYLQTRDYQARRDR